MCFKLRWTFHDIDNQTKPNFNIDKNALAESLRQKDSHFLLSHLFQRLSRFFQSVTNSFLSFPFNKNKNKNKRHILWEKKKDFWSCKRNEIKISLKTAPWTFVPCWLYFCHHPSSTSIACNMHRKLFVIVWVFNLLSLKDK